MSVKIIQKNKKTAKIRRHLRARKNIAGTSERPRLVVFRGNKHIFAQIIDDTQGKTLAAISTINLDSKKDDDKIAKAKLAGQKLADVAKSAKINKVVFDTGGNKYHGRVAALADGAREGGLKF
ncbi:MAG: 50S ribosomal protein L18 [Bifidobacteriaceae bacterium]|jgi:large subunit ribosomal protein L18|nr:50S ribosomal protein L18 [Bifidobacteriaceae bacterium]